MYEIYLNSDRYGDCPEWRLWGAESSRDNAVSVAWDLEDEVGVGNVEIRYNGQTLDIL